MMQTRDPKKLFPEINVPKVAPKPDDRVTEIRRYKLITPLFGGGVEAPKADPITIIRGASVRGQLRFWWRATRGGQFGGDLKKMRQAENAIWGSAAKKNDETSGPSRVLIVVTEIEKGKPLATVEVPNRRTRKNDNVPIGEPRSPFSYVAFPLRKEPNKSAGSVQENVTFKLTIQYAKPENEKDGKVGIDGHTLVVRDEVLAALWAWEAFGGIGARTRRGFGSLQLTHINEKEIQLPGSAQLHDHLGNGFKRHFLPGTWFQGIPYLVPDSVVVVPTSKSSDLKQTWRKLFEKMKEFRQSRYPGKDNRPGRSKWPEPDSIRRLTGGHSAGHEPKHPVKNKFPRAQFGLPINFKFKDEDKGDPSASTLKPKNSERWASPLILRPFACADGYVGLAVRLSSRLSDLPDGLVLENATFSQPKPINGTVEVSDALQIEALNGATDVLQAFLEFLKK